MGHKRKKKELVKELPKDASFMPEMGAVVHLTKGDEHVLGMFSTEGVGLALQESEWDVEEEMQEYISIARNPCEKPETRLAAIRQLNQRVERIAEINGLINKGTVKVTQQVGDRTVEAVKTEQKLIRTIQKGNPNAKSKSEGNKNPFAGRTIKPIETNPSSDFED